MRGMCARVGCETTHFTARSKQKEKVVVFVMCIWDAQRERSNGGGATRFEFLNFSPRSVYLGFFPFLKGTLI